MTAQAGAVLDESARWDAIDWRSVRVASSEVLLNDFVASPEM
jgi:hypothetical protein